LQVVHRGLRLKKDSVAARLVGNLLVFALAGLMHVGIGWRMGTRCGHGNEFLWWMGNFCAIVAEMAVSAVSEGLRKSMGWGRLKVVERVVGYLWVFGWLFWSLPKNHWRKLMCGLSAA
jgi:hypothetical protein